jgi:NTE family protein
MKEQIGPDQETPSYLPRPALERSGIALCLSGGGFRAALFHLGALRRLNELGVLSQVDSISSVSGGSILAGHLAARLEKWPAAGQSLASDAWERQVASPFRAFTSRDIRTGPILQRWLSPANILRPQTTVEALARVYQKRLIDRTLAQLPERPRYIFCATDLYFGVNWIFERRQVGDYRAGYIRPPPPNWPVARAVAASSCFPPIFGPMKLNLIKEKLVRGSSPPGIARASYLRAFQLSDGGVYDNMGLEPVWKNSRVCIVSDGGAPFPFQNETRPFRRLLRYITVANNQAAAVRKRWLIANFKNEVMEGTYWGLTSAATSYSSTDPNRPTVLPPQSYSDELVKGSISRIRTDMNAFSDAEIQILENHGYFLAEAAIQNHLHHLIAANPQPFQPPHPNRIDDDSVRRALRNSDKRFSLVKILAEVFS